MLILKTFILEINLRFILRLILKLNEIIKYNSKQINLQ